MSSAKLGDVVYVGDPQERATVAAGDGKTIRCARWNNDLLRMDEVVSNEDAATPTGELFFPVEIRVGDTVSLRSGSPEMIVVRLIMSSFDLIVADLAVWDASNNKFKFLHAGVDMLKRT